MLFTRKRPIQRTFMGCIKMRGNLEKDVELAWTFHITRKPFERGSGSYEKSLLSQPYEGKGRGIRRAAASEKIPMVETFFMACEVFYEKNEFCKILCFFY